MSENKYIASVVTPFHNTNLEFFRRGFESVCNQTVGVDNIEWLIVVHNSEPSFLQGVREMTEGFDNFRVFELNNEIHSASSPRNYAMDHATGKYVFFLDSDDYFTPECIKDVTDRMEKAKANYAKIRSEKALEDDHVVEFVEHRVRYDQTEDMIVLPKGDPRIKDILTANGMTPWSQVFLREFLEKHGLRYNVDIAVGEDLDFTIRAMHSTDSILLLPQTIGYVYYINHASTLQQMGALTPEAVLGMGESMAMINRMGIDAGLDMRYLFWDMMNQYSGMVMSCPELTGDQIAHIKSIIAPLYDLIQPLDADGKFYTQTDVEEITNRFKAVFMDDKKEHSYMSLQDSILLSILHDNQNTDIGRKYEFNLIHNAKAFESRVPVSDYGFYKPLIELTTRIGEDKIFCSDKVLGYAYTAGPTGERKRIPFTKNHIISYFSILYHAFGGRSGSTLAMVTCQTDGPRNKDRTCNYQITGAVVRGFYGEILDNSHQAGNKDYHFTSPRELVFLNESCNLKHERLLFALLDKEMTQIFAPFMWPVLEMVEYMATHHEVLISDLKNGTISSNNNISDDLKNKVARRLKRNPGRADELEAIFKEGFDGPILKKIWPNLNRIVAVGTGGFSIYRDRLRRYTGDEIQFDNGVYFSSESMVGMSVGAEDDRYKLLTGHDYFEFLPVGDDPENGLLRPNMLKPGEEYEVVVTNRAGLYRYRLGDIIRVDHLDHTVPVFTFSRRIHQTCKMAGILMREDDIYTVVKRVSVETGLDIADYAYVSDEENSSFRIWLEPSSVGDSYDKALSLQKDLADTVEQVLCDVLEDYAAARQSGRLKPAKVYILEPETQIMKRDRDMYLRNCMSDQMKPVRMIMDEKTEQFFMKMSTEI